MGYSARYHAVSLVAVFIALAIGILIGAAAKRRDTLIAYFRRRHARGERLRLASSRFTGNSPHYGNFEMLMGRSVPGVAGGDWLPVPGKGAAICHEGETRLIVMSFGRVGGV